MRDEFRIEVKGAAELKRQLAALDDVLADDILLMAAVAGAMPILNQAKRNAHKVTGTLARSLHVGGFTDRTPDFRPGSDEADYDDIGGDRSSRNEAEVHIGTDVPYGRREELGFVGADSLGRHYTFEGHPYLRPAFTDKSEAAVREVGAALRAQLRHLSTGRVSPRLRALG